MSDKNSNIFKHFSESPSCKGLYTPFCYYQDLSNCFAVYLFSAADMLFMSVQISMAIPAYCFCVITIVRLKIFIKVKDSTPFRG